MNFSDPFGLFAMQECPPDCVPEPGSQGIESVGLGPLEWIPGPKAAMNIARKAGGAAMRRVVASEAGEAIATGFARWNFRRNLTREIGEVAGAEAHHIFPYALRDRFEQLGIQVNNPVSGPGGRRQAIGPMLTPTIRNGEHS